MKNNKYRQAEFLISAYKPTQFPPDSGSEVAFAGRSNSGKSSVINVVTGKRALARVSKTPGRTQMINFFSVTAEVRLVDLPGYGYASVPEAMRQHWAKLINAYFDGRKSLQGLILVTDIRRRLTAYDEQMLAWSLARRLPVRILLNKADKLSYGAARQALAEVTAAVTAESTTVQLFSALKKSGAAEVCRQLDDWLG